MSEITIDGATYTLDNAGNRTAKTDQRAAVISNYGYDAIYELTGVTQGTNTTESYTYDPVGNRLSSLGVSPYNVNVSNQLTSTPSTSYTYDHNGNTLTKIDSTGTTTYTWDFENRLTSVTLPGTGGTVTFRYNPFSRRIQKSFTTGANPPTTTTTNYLYDGDNGIEEIDPSGSVLARYSDSLGIDEPLAMLRSGTTSYYHADGLGSVTSLSNAAGALSQTYTFDSFGKQTALSGSLTNSFRFTAREFDTETSLYFYRARYYDPNAGRFLAEDPNDQGTLGEATNLYRYAENSPANYADPYGLFTRKSGAVPWPSLPIQALLDCIEYKTDLKLVVTSTSDSHPPTDLHTLGGAVDLRYPPDPNDVKHILCAAKDCGAGYALNEQTKRPESPHWDGAHIHLQIPLSKSGKHGDLPSGNCCEK